MMEGAKRGSYGLAHTKGGLSMTIKSKLIPFFATGVLLSSVAALAQTRVNPDTGSSTTGQASGMQPSTNSGDSTATTGYTMGASPGVGRPAQSSGDAADRPASPPAAAWVACRYV